ncbi:MAG: potassium transporter, partial [Rectinema sp.]|nr:potassium transporter [Rectinema sp.]
MRKYRHVTIGKDKVLLVLYFFGLIAVGSMVLSFPFAMRKGTLRYIDALFTATSAVCVTGLTTVDTTGFSRAGQAIIAMLIQMGGLGIISFSTIYLFLPRRRISVFTRGFAGDYTIPTVEYRTRTVISRIIAWTLIFEVLGTLSILPTLSQAGYSFFDAVFHSISAFCNAGFSTVRGGMESFRDNVTMNIATMVLIISGGLGFIVLQDISRFMRGKKAHLSYHSSVVVRTSLWLIVGGALLFFIFESNHALSLIHI